MGTVSDIPRHDIDPLDGPEVLEASNHFVKARLERMRGVYKVLGLVRGKRRKERKEIIKNLSLNHGGGAAEGLEEDLKWAAVVDLLEMLKTFALEGVDSDWPKRLTQTHFRIVGSARKNESPMTSAEAIDWLVKAYHGHWFSGAFHEAVTGDGWWLPANLAPTRKVKGTPATALDLLDVMLRQLRKSGTDYLLEGLKEGTFKVGPTMRKLADGWAEHHPTATFVIANDEQAKGTS